MVIGIVVAVFGCLVLSLIVFGGGQVFIPLFSSLWQLVEKASGHTILINGQTINDIISIANATPGVVSTKFALITGYIVANGEWWGWLLMFVTYLIFVMPAILLMIFGMKLLKKSKTNPYLKNMVIFLRPVIAGILFALAVELLISSMFPHVIFNQSMGHYLGITNKGASSFFAVGSWRFILLLIWVPFVIIESFVLMKKYKVSLFTLVVTHLIVALIIFAPWAIYLQN